MKIMAIPRDLLEMLKVLQKQKCLSGGIVKAGILKAFSGKVNLIRREDLPDEWDPTTDNILCVWEATQYLIKRLEMEENIQLQVF